MIVQEFKKEFLKTIWCMTWINLICLWHYEVRSAKQTIFLFVLAWNQTKGWARDLRRDRKRKRNRERRVGEGRRSRAVASRQRTAEETSRHEIGSRCHEGRPVKMSQHSKWLVEISRRTHINESLQLHRESRVSQLALLALWVDLSHIVRLFFFSPSFGCISCGHKKCVIPLDDSPTKIEMV